LEQLESGLSEARASVRILSMRGVPFVDTSAVSYLHDYCKDRQKEGVTVLFSSIQPSVKEMLDKAGISDLIGQDAFFMNAKDAILSRMF
jgi:SulP family sulfate permease